MPTFLDTHPAKFTKRVEPLQCGDDPVAVVNPSPLTSHFTQKKIRGRPLPSRPRAIGSKKVLGSIAAPQPDRKRDDRVGVGEFQDSFQRNVKAVEATVGIARVPFRLILFTQ